MPRHTDSEIEQAAQRFEQLVDTLAPTTAQVEGTDVALSSDERAQLGGVHYRTQPAILLAQFARSAQASGIGPELLTHAARTAQETLWYVGATALVVDPFDEATEAYWREHWGLRLSEQRVPGNRQLRRLYGAIPRES